LFKLPVDKKIILYSAGTHYDSDFFLETIYKIQKMEKNVILITTGERFGQKLQGKIYDNDRILEFGFLPYEKYTSLLPAADLFLFPFAKSELNEGRWPNKIGDYMAAGRPTISNPTGDIVDLFKKHKIGVLAPEKPYIFASDVVALLKNEELLIDLGHRARSTAEQFYDWKIMAKKLERIFIDVADEGLTLY
jgi:glycosyltransferase involved in cell wall biosynthesis